MFSKPKFVLHVSFYDSTLHLSHPTFSTSNDGHSLFSTRVYYVFSVEGKKDSSLLPVRGHKSFTFSQTTVDCRHKLVKLSTQNLPDLTVFHC